MVVLLGHLLELGLERVPLLLKSLDLALKILNLQLVLAEPSYKQKQCVPLVPLCHYSVVQAGRRSLIVGLFVRSLFVCEFKFPCGEIIKRSKG